MRLHYWSQDNPDGWRNLGDYLSVPICRWLGVDPEPPEPGQPVLFATGTIIHADHFRAVGASRVVVWGSGCGDESPPLPIRDVKFRAVRGPLTRNRLRLFHGIPLGDPALLLPRFVVPERTGGFVYVNHCGRWHEPLHPDGWDRSVSMLVKESEAITRVRDIASADFVASESLHGCIIAAAFGVPWAPCSALEPQPTPGWKWHDWMAYLGLPRLEAFLPANPVAAMAWWMQTGRHGRLGSTDALLDAFPRTL